MQPQKSFPDVSQDLDFPRQEARVLAFWKERGIFAKSLQHRAGAPTFVFYEGPPTANGVPHNGHVLTRVMKDLFPRYKTMRGFSVPRKAGWDTHGLPVEVEVEKELRIHGKAAIEAYGVEPFTAKCIESVFRYKTQWEENTERLGYWVDLEDAYVTFHRSYVESVWWALADLFEKGLLYQSHKVVWWWAQGGTALSSGEVGQGYKTVDDPSCTVSFPLVDGDGFELLVWTTTPWTLPSNAYAAVHPQVDYAYAQLGERKVVGHAPLLDALARKLKVSLTVLRTVRGEDLVGLAYAPPFDIYRETKSMDSPYWKVVAADFVTLDTGTGIVHLAPAFGQDDFETHRRVWRALGKDPEPPPCAVAADGTFTADFPAHEGQWVKACDDAIALDLKERGLLVLKEQYRHDYPFCWRADDDPLIQYARPAWYIRTTQKIADAIQNNQAIRWAPEHIKEGRFGDFLRNNVDWALSRERYWGTPLPIWQNTSLPEGDPRRAIAIPSLAALRAMPRSNVAEVEALVAAAVPDPERAHHLLVHKPWIDKVTFEQDGVPGVYRRVPEVIDCWFDSGCMPFAQWGFPHREGSHEKLRAAFPADFISEAIDQTRGWFYSLLMVSTLVFDEKKRDELGLRAGGARYPHPYETCILLGHVCDKDGKKESKSKGNYTPPSIILDSVRMDFAVTPVEDLQGLSKAPGHAHIAGEDFEGLDLGEASSGLAAKVRLFGPGSPEGLEVELHATKGLRRRVIALAPEDRARLGVTPVDDPAHVLPVEVPSLPAERRVAVFDPATPAPGADAFRWFFYASSPPWTNTRHSLKNVRALQKDFHVKLRNVFSFFTIYANIDGYSPAIEAPPVAERPELCRWVLSELALTVRDVTAHLDAFRAYEAAGRLTDFVDALSNWYVRRSRERFWAPGAGADMTADKRSAYATLYECLVTLSKLSAPFVPFFAEELHQGLVVAPGIPGAPESVHLADWPEVDGVRIDAALSEEMSIVRGLVSLGRDARETAQRRTRQPLARADVVLARPALAARIRPHLALLEDELNVARAVLVETTPTVKYAIKPNFRVLGQRLGKKVQRLKEALERVDAAALQRELAAQGTATVSVDGEDIALTPEEVEVRVSAEEGFAASGGVDGVVVLDTTLTEALLELGLARELQSRLSAMRKEMGLSFTDRVVLAIEAGPRLRAVVERHRDAILQAALVTELSVGSPTFEPEKRASLVLDGEEIVVSLARSV